MDKYWKSIINLNHKSNMLAFLFYTNALIPSFDPAVSYKG